MLQRICHSAKELVKQLAPAHVPAPLPHHSALLGNLTLCHLHVQWLMARTLQQSRLR